ncbi:sugar ABC transporter ATP-binding protein [Microbacterium sp. X-17]|uniref:sugar ABC transporter ATP-binding protein n=1 Tax=Microbacterium sp. X-17 TaxID=3144404 RepID=UPI0031F51FEF
MSATGANAVVITDLVKTYGAIRALKGVSLALPEGEIHALVGENGAGKSTALGVLAGRTAPTSGRVEVFGEEPRYGDPRAARRAGVVAIYQELTIVPALTAPANVYLPGPLSRGGFLRESEMRRRYVALCKRVGVAPVAPGVLARDLSVAEQQILEILRAVVSDARVILFDEPTASLAEAERSALFTLMRTLRTQGVTMVLVSHNLDEVLNIADTVTVFRDGRLAANGRRAEFTKESLVTAMLGDHGLEEVSERLLGADAEAGAIPRRVSHADRQGPPLLAVSDVTVPGAITGVSLEVYPGEVVGIGGLVGSGRTTLLRALAGMVPKAKGRMWIDGKEVPWPRSVRRALRYGIALVPEDRKTQGLVMTMSVMDNIALSGYRSTTRAGFVTPSSLERATREVAAAFGISPTRLRHRASTLSGGNQQKVLLARWKHVTPRVLLADEPTRGIDVGAKAEILTSLEAMAAKSLGLVVVSSELEEVIAVSDRITVLSEGLPMGTLDNADGSVTAEGILNLAFRVYEEGAEAAQPEYAGKEAGQ